MFYQAAQREKQQQRGWEEKARERRLNLTHQLLPSQIKIIQQDSFLSVSRPKHLGFHYAVNICVYGAHKHNRYYVVDVTRDTYKLLSAPEVNIFHTPLVP